MNAFLLVHAGYHTFSVGLFKNTTLIKAISGDKKLASKQLMPAIENLTAISETSLDALSFIAADIGPGPFTSVRIAVTTVNGLGFALNKPLVGVNSFEALLMQENDPQWSSTVALYNGYNNDLYYAWQLSDQPLSIGAVNKNKFLDQLSHLSQHYFPLRFIGDGVPLIKNDIISLLGEAAYIPAPLPQEPSLESLGNKAFELFQAGVYTSQLTPLYLKLGYNL